MKPGDGPAFARSGSRDGMAQEDVTLRDYFAAHSDGPSEWASAEYVALKLGIKPPKAGEEWAWWRRAEALWRYANADAMLAARGEH